MFSTLPTPFPDLNAVLTELVTGVQSALGDNLIGVYLHGSFALGDFDEDSDVDFLVVTQQEITEAQLALLQALHARIFAMESPWAQHLDGSYITATRLRHPDPTKGLLWYLDNCSSTLALSDHENRLLVRRVVREKGIVLTGPEPHTLVEPVADDDLRREAWRFMQAWAEEVFAAPEAMNNRWYQPYAVLSFCRMLYTLHTGQVSSKPVAARWGRETLDKKWDGLIQRARAERPNPSLKVRLPADPADVASTLEFMEYALQIGRQL